MLMLSYSFCHGSVGLSHVYNAHFVEVNSSSEVILK